MTKFYFLSLFVSVSAFAECPNIQVDNWDQAKSFCDQPDYSCNGDSNMDGRHKLFYDGHKCKWVFRNDGSYIKSVLKNSENKSGPTTATQLAALEQDCKSKGLKVVALQTNSSKKGRHKIEETQYACDVAGGVVTTQVHVQAKTAQATAAVSQVTKTQYADVASIIRKNSELLKKFRALENTRKPFSLSDVDAELGKKYPNVKYGAYKGPTRK